MSADFFITQGDRLPQFAFICRNADRTPADLAGSGTTAFLRFRALDADESSATVQPADITGDLPGKIRYAWQEGDTAIAGTFLAEVLIVFPDGRPETFPSGPCVEFPSGYVRIKVKPRV